MPVSRPASPFASAPPPAWGCRRRRSRGDPAKFARLPVFSVFGEAPQVPRFIVPNSVSIHNAHAFLRANQPFENGQGEACLELHPRWAHMEPLALSMIA